MLKYLSKMVIIHYHNNSALINTRINSANDDDLIIPINFNSHYKACGLFKMTSILHRLYYLYVSNTIEDL